MTYHEPTLDEWRKLYDVTARVKEAAPWKWLIEIDMFGVQNPETDAIGFVSVMGELGEHFAVAVYLGVEGLGGFWRMQQGPPEMTRPELLLETPQLQASFEDRDILRDQDRAVIKRLGLKFRGKSAWPMFRSYIPGYAPWFVESAEAQFLTHVLEQTLDVAQRVKENPDLLTVQSETSYLVRVSHNEGDTLKWQDQIINISPPEAPLLAIQMDMALLERLKRLPKRGRMEIDLFMLLSVIQEKRDERPIFPYVLMAVDGTTGAVVGYDMLHADPALQTVWESVPLSMARVFGQMGYLPRRVSVSSDLMLQLLRPLADELDFRVRQVASLPKLDPARESMRRYM
ncbi:MAG: hypothetical protein JXJ20_02920 [Anaerolineae bacterium]|nr:hypothetical protein [Anaerolineae bacterium]